MIMLWSVVTLLLFSVSSYSVYGDISSKLNFEEDELSTEANATSSDGQDLEVKHTIVVSTKLKNNNRRGIHRSDAGEMSGILGVNYGRTQPKQDSGEVPVYSGMRAVETTQIRTPDTRYKTKIYPDSVFVSRNLRDENDVFPNIASNPSQWKPNNYYKNINWWGAESGDNYNIVRRIDVPNNYNRNNQKKISDEAVKEFYCKKCRELSGQVKGCVQERSNPWIVSMTTPKIKIDGKIAKLN